MRIVQVNQSDSGGGGFIQPLRLHRAFGQLGHESFLVVLNKETDEPGVIPLVHHKFLAKVLWRVLDTLNSFRLRAYRGSPCYGWVDHNIGTWALKIINQLTPDVVNLNFFNCLLNSSQVAKLNGLRYWTFHDMSPFTGGCHCTPICNRYQVGCGKCVELESEIECDISKQGYHRREQIWGAGIVGIAQSRWLAETARSSLVCQGRDVEMIHNGVPLEVFNPERREHARKQFGFRNEKCYVLAGSAANTNPLKGMGFVEEAIRILWTRYPKKIVWVTFGQQSQNVSYEGEVRQMGYLKKDSDLADLYAACDVYVLPTLLDSLPTTLIESIACGTPGITFNIGGCVDIIEDGINGRVLKEHSGDAIADAVEFFMTLSPAKKQSFRNHAREIACQKFDVMDCAQAYLDLFCKGMKKE